MINSEHAIRLRVLLGFLKAGRVLDQGSSVLLLGALPGAVVSAGNAVGIGVFGAAVLLGLLEKYLAWRVALDVEFFALLLEHSGQEALFDAALACFLGRPVAPEARAMASRWQGARRLVRLQATAAVGQALAVTAGVVCYICRV